MISKARLGTVFLAWGHFQRGWARRVTRSKLSDVRLCQNGSAACAMVSSSWLAVTFPIKNSAFQPLMLTRVLPPSSTCLLPVNWAVGEEVRNHIPARWFLAPPKDGRGDASVLEDFVAFVFVFVYVFQFLFHGTQSKYYAFIYISVCVCVRVYMYRLRPFDSYL